MRSAIRHAVFATAAILLLAACGGDSDNDDNGGSANNGGSTGGATGGGTAGGGTGGGTDGGTGGGAVTLASQVSPGFATAFGQDSTATPAIVTSTSLPPIDVTGGPIAVP